MSQQPIIILVPGAWSLPFFYDGLRSSISRQGLTSPDAIAHPSVGAEPPTKTLDDDVYHLRDVLTEHCDSGKNVVVVAHSYGGLVSSGAVQGLGVQERKSKGKTGGVSLIIYMTAFVVPKGQSLISASGGQLLPWIKTEVSSAISLRLIFRKY